MIMIRNNKKAARFVYLALGLFTVSGLEMILGRLNIISTDYVWSIWAVLAAIFTMQLAQWLRSN